MNALVLALAVKSSVIIAAAAAANATVFRRTSAASRHLVWTVAVAAVLVLPILSIVVPSWKIPIHVVVPAAPVSAATTIDDVPSTGTMTLQAAAPAGPAAPLASGAGTISWTTMLLGIYLAVAGLLVIRLLAGRWTLRQLVRRSTDVTDADWCALVRDCGRSIGVARPVRLLRSLDQTMPMAFGTRTPTILIPAVADTWSDDRRRAVLLHELAHIDRRDCFTQLVAALSCALYWIHPGVWWVARRLRVERELACDDRVLAVGTVARDYAAHLLELAYTLGGSRAPALVVSMARPQQLEGRMLAVLDAARNRATPAFGTRIASLGIAAMCVVPLAAADTFIVSDSAVVPGSAMLPELGSANAPLDRTPMEQGRQVQLPGTWEIQQSSDAKTVHLQLSERRNSMHGFSITLDQLEGLSASMLSGSGGPVKFNIRRDAGTITFEGTFRSGVGAGTFDFAPSSTFPAEMARRGFESPTTDDQYRLAVGNVGFAYLDELNAQKYAGPNMVGLVRAADHGVSLDYLKEMGQAGYHLGQIASLVETRDHGVTPQYIRGMADEGFKNMSADELVRTRDHGVTPDYAKAMRDFGFKTLTVDDLVNARDHGVSTDFVKGMRDTGYDRLSIEELVTARDHGVNAEFAKGMHDLGFKPSLDELRRARDHGVTTEYARAITALGYERISIDELVRLRDHGVTAAFVKDQNSRPRGRLTIDELIRRRNGGR
jgi:beta-lactamase regulating signal transducer with metallopeptidase domain